MSQNWDYPTGGGTYTRDDATGALTRIEPPLPVDTAPPEPAPEADADLATDPASSAQPTTKSRKGTA